MTGLIPIAGLCFFNTKIFFVSINIVLRQTIRLHLATPNFAMKKFFLFFFKAFLIVQETRVAHTNTQYTKMYISYIYLYTSLEVCVSYIDIIV